MLTRKMFVGVPWAREHRDDETQRGCTVGCLPFLSWSRETGCCDCILRKAQDTSKTMEACVRQEVSVTGTAGPLARAGSPTCRVSKRTLAVLSDALEVWRMVCGWCGREDVERRRGVGAAGVRLRDFFLTTRAQITQGTATWADACLADALMRMFGM